MSLQLVKNCRDDNALRASFNQLARTVFSIDFEPWHRQGFWDDAYTPYSFVEDGRVVANVSGTLLRTCVDGEPRTVLQIGTVMTHPDCRGRGLARRLMQALLSDWEGRCDTSLLYANREVTGFYPKFGYHAAHECSHSFTVPEAAPPPHTCRPLRMDAAGRALLARLVRATPPAARVAPENGAGIVLFHCGTLLREAVWHIEALNAAVVARPESDGLHLLGVFGPHPPGVRLAAEVLMRGQGGRVHLGFTPLPQPGFTASLLADGDDVLFVRGRPLPPGTRFPALYKT